MESFKKFDLKTYQCVKCKRILLSEMRQQQPTKNTNANLSKHILNQNASSQNQKNIFQKPSKTTFKQLSQTINLNKTFFENLKSNKHSNFAFNPTQTPISDPAIQNMLKGFVILEGCNLLFHKHIQIIDIPFIDSGDNQFYCVYRQIFCGNCLKNWSLFIHDCGTNHAQNKIKNIGVVVTSANKTAQSLIGKVLLVPSQIKEVILMESVDKILDSNVLDKVAKFYESLIHQYLVKKEQLQSLKDRQRGLKEFLIRLQNISENLRDQVDEMSIEG